MKPVDVVRALQSDDETKQRQALMEAWESCEDFFVGLQMSMDPQAVPNVPSVPKIDEADDGTGSYSFEEFTVLFEKLCSDINPKEAKKLIISAAMRANVSEWNLFYRKILRKNLQDSLPMGLVADVLQKLTGIQIQL